MFIEILSVMLITVLIANTILLTLNKLYPSTALVAHPDTRLTRNVLRTLASVL